MKKFQIHINSQKTQPQIPADGNLTFLKLAEKLLTPDEIKQAVEAGRQDHEAAFAAKVREKTI